MQSSQTFFRLQQLSKKLQNYPPSSNQGTTNPTVSMIANQSQELLRHHQQSSSNSLTSIKQQLSMMMNQLHQIIRVSNIRNIEADNKIDNVRDEMMSAIKYQNISTKNNAEQIESQLKNKQNQLNKNNGTLEIQTQTILVSLKKKGFKLASNIFLELQNYKQTTRKHMSSDEQKLHNYIGQIKQILTLQTKERKDSMQQIQKIIQGVEDKLREKIELMGQEKDLFFKKLLIQLQKGLQKIIK